jgi:hypothetical protein
METVLQEEARERFGLFSTPLAPGRLKLEGTLPAGPLVFEWQRMPDARFFPLEKKERPPPPVAEAFWSFFAETPTPWALHAVPAPESEQVSSGRLAAVIRDLLRTGKELHPELMRWERKPAKLFRTSEGRVLQVSGLRNGFLFSCASPSDLTSQVPGGELRMKMDEDAPSRSYLKIEEAFHRMGVEPKAEETVIDLGAAPGGWSYACAKRGARVTAVDNGPLKIRDACIRRIEQLHVDGLSFRLSKHQPPVDWLVSDMLISPGDGFGLLKHWVDGHHCSRIVMNLKLPQQHPMSALQPVLDWLEHHPTLHMRQLCHDRREVTVFGTV